MTKSLHQKWWTHGLFIISIGILFVVVAWSIKTAKQPALVNTMKPAGLTPCDHLMEARKALMDGYKPDEDPIKTTWGRVYDARIHLEAIKHDFPEYPEAERLMDEVRRREAEMERTSAIITQGYLKKQREEVVGKLERYFVGKEMCVQVQLEGEEEAILRLEYMFWSRPLVYRVVNGTGFLPALKKIGFKKVIFDATHEYSWTYDLEGNTGKNQK